MAAQASAAAAAYQASQGKESEDNKASAPTVDTTAAAGDSASDEKQKETQREIEDSLGKLKRLKRMVRKVERQEGTRLPVERTDQGSFHSRREQSPSEAVRCHRSNHLFDQFKQEDDAWGDGDGKADILDRETKLHTSTLIFQAKEKEQKAKQGQQAPPSTVATRSRDHSEAGSPHTAPMLHRLNSGKPTANTRAWESLVAQMDAGQDTDSLHKTER